MTFFELFVKKRDIFSSIYIKNVTFFRENAKNLSEKRDILKSQFELRAMIFLRSGRNGPGILAENGQKIDFLKN